MKPLRIFRSQGNCGCSSSGSSQTLTNTGQCLDPDGQPVALICDPKYLSLGSVTRVRPLGVPLGGQCQNYLKAATAGGRGFVFFGADGQMYVETAPELSLPMINPISGGAYPLPGGFQFLLVGSGVDPIPWRMVAAPTEGSYSLISEAGSFQLRDITSASGNTAVCNTTTETEKGNVISCFDTGEVDAFDNTIYALRKITARHERVMVGDIDGDGVRGYKAIADDETLNHPLAAFNSLKGGTYFSIDVTDGSVEGNGLPLQDAEDTDITAELVVYSGDSHKFYRLPTRTKETLTTDADQAVADNGTYVTMGTHCNWNDLQFNFPDFFISATIRLANDSSNYAAVDYGLFVDGVLVHNWDVKGSKDNTLTHLYKGLTPGTHDIEIKFRQTGAAGDSTIKYSDAQIFTVL